MVNRSDKHFVLNDPVGLALEAYEKLYPGRTLFVWFDPGCENEKKGKRILRGRTQRTAGKPPQWGIALNPWLPSGKWWLLRTMCHELAHTIQWKDGHGPKFRKVFKRIYAEARKQHRLPAWRKPARAKAAQGGGGV